MLTGWSRHSSGGRATEVELKKDTRSLEPTGWNRRARLVAGVILVAGLAVALLVARRSSRDPGPAMQTHAQGGGASTGPTLRGPIPAGPAQESGLGPDPAYGTTIRVVDIATGGAAGGVPVEFTHALPAPSTARRVVRARSDANGEIQLVDADVLGFEVLDPQWRGADQRGPWNGRRPLETIYVTRTTSLRGTIRFVGLPAGVPLPRVRIDVCRPLLRDAPEDASRIGSTAWLVRHGLQRPVRPDDFKVDDSGVFEGRVAMLPGMYLAARAEGWRCDPIPLDAVIRGDGGQPDDVTLVLHRAPRLHGLLVDGAGVPLARHPVSLYLEIREGATDSDSIEAETQGSGIAVRLRDKQSGESSLFVSEIVYTDELGQFEFPVTLGSRFQGTLVVTASGHVPLLRDVGSEPARPEEALRLELTPWNGDAPRIQVRVGGEPFTDGFVALTRNTGGFAHTVSEVPDERGFIDASCLERGVYFTITCFRGELHAPATPPPTREYMAHGHLSWDGRRVVEVTELDTKYSLPR